MALGLGHGLSYPTWREQMTETTEIHRFKAGDDVPSWLVAFTPQSEDAVRGTITFERNTAVVKVDGVYWLLCLDSPHMQAVIRIDNANKMNIKAAICDGRLFHHHKAEDLGADGTDATGSGKGDAS